MSLHGRSECHLVTVQVPPIVLVLTSFIKHRTGTALSGDNGRTLVTTAPPKFLQWPVALRIPVPPTSSRSPTPVVPSSESAFLDARTFAVVRPEGAHVLDRNVSSGSRK
jgi:hypothetical protein